MPVIPAKLGPASWKGGSFRPYGKVIYSGSRPNPVTRSKGAVYAARLFVGFSVDEVPTYSMDDLMALVQDERADHPDASFISQRGIYMSRKPPHKVVREEGAQVIIVNTRGVPMKEFAREIIDLAERICAEFQQEEVIVEMQRNGKVIEIVSVTP